MAPREYILLGLALGVYLTWLWPLLASMHLVAMPDPVMLFIAVNDIGSSFTLTVTDSERPGISGPIRSITVSAKKMRIFLS